MPLRVKPPKLMGSGAGFVVAVLLALLAFVGLVGDADAAFPNGYTYRRLIDITDAQVSSGPHTNFPIVVSTTLADLKTTANGGDVTDAQGDDIIFTDSDGTTQLSHEVEKYTATTGELVAWVRVPSLAAASTIYMYYGNSSVTTFQGNVTSNGVTGVWDTNYRGVWHLKEDPAGTAPQMKDSTSNVNHGTTGGTMTSTDQVAGQVDGSLELDGANDWVDFPDTQQTIPNGSQFTISSWVYAGTATLDEYNMVLFGRTSNGVSKYPYGLALNQGSGGTTFRGIISNGVSSQESACPSVSTNTWTHLVVVFNGTQLTCFKNGVSGTPVTITLSGTYPQVPSTYDYGESMGRSYAGSNYFNGTIDEVRASNSVRSAGWIATGYNNQNSPSTFYTVGAEEGGVFTKLQLLVPGETAAPGTPSGKTGTPTAQTAGTAFTVTVNAVDANWNRVNTVTDTVGITSSDANATLPANAALVAGTRTFSVTLNTAGTATVTASDITQPAKTPNTSPSITVNAPPPFVSGYTYRRLIDITDALVSGGPHTNFPMLFCVTLLDLRTTANGGKVTDPQGDDIVFTASDGTTRLAHEVEKYVATTGELIAWVRVPSLAATSTIYIYYGNSSVTTFQGNVTSNGVTGVWDTDYKGVWHLNQSFSDSTSYGNNGTNNGTTDVAGKIASGRDFEASTPSQYISVADSVSLHISSQITVEAWVNPETTSAWRTMVSKMTGSTEDLYFVVYGGNLYIGLAGTGSDWNSGVALSTGVWQRVAVTYDGSYIRMYKNGALGNSVAKTGNLSLGSNTNPLYIGYNTAWPGELWDGQLDEVRISSTARSAGWILTEFNNQSACAGFFTVGAEETGVVTPGGFNAYETATAAGAITGVIKTKIAGASVSLDMIALNVAKTAIATTFTGTVRVEVLNTSNNSGALDGNNCRPTWTVIQTLSPDPAFAAPDNGRKAISFTEANSYPDARLRITYPAGAPTVTGCSTDNFAIRPNTFSSFSVTDTDWQTAGTGRALNDLTFGTVTHKAGRPLSVRATALNAAGTPATTTNYVGAPTATLTACGGAACTATFGALTLTTTFVAGQLTSDVASYNNVGSFWLQLVDSAFASVDAADGSTTTERNITSAVNNVGRFVPDHFAVSLNTPVFGTACGAGGFTYVGQTFNYTTAPVITVTAQDFANSTTTLYADATKWWRITNASLTGKSYTAAAGTLDSSGITGTDPVIAVAGSGMGTLTFSSGTGLFFTRTTPVAPFDADISLALNVIDADGVILASNPARFGTATAGTGIAFSSGKPMRFGRLALRNANGSQLVPLSVPMETQYWNGSAFITNVDDSCTTIAANNIAMSNFTQNLAACETAISVSGAFSAGRKTLQLAAPGSANNGSVDLTVNLGASASGNTCTAVGAGPGPLTTTANLPYLQGNWTGINYDQNPSARATFGVYKGSEEVIFIRENF